jgi:hypothetical protein
VSADPTRLLLKGVRDALEESLLAIVDRASAAEVAERLREAIAILNRRIEAPARDAEALDELDRAAVTMRAAGEALRGDEVTARRIEGAARRLSEASEGLRRGLSARPAGPPGTQRSDEMLASVGVPRAHHADVPAPRVLAREDRATEVRRARAALEASPGSAGEIEQIRALARDCFEDIASLGSLRRLYDSEPWVDAGPFEQRLLDNLDAVVALDRPLSPRAPSLGLVEALYAYATEWTVPDFGRTFALAFTLCCLAPEAAMRWVVLALRRSHPRTYPAFVDAFALGSNEAIDRTLAELCSDDDPAIVGVAIEAMARRGRPGMSSTVLLLARPSPGLAVKAIELAARLPAQAVGPLLSRFLSAPDPVAAASAAAALVTLGDPRGAKHLRELLGRRRTSIEVGDMEGPAKDAAEGRARADADARRVALETLCLLGNPADRELVAAEAVAVREALPWLGWHGAPEHVPVLVAALREALAAGGMYDVVDGLARTLERIGGERLPRLGQVGPSELEARATQWAQSLQERRPPDATRLRFGRAWTPLAVIDELQDRTTKQGERPTLARELALVTRRSAHIDVAGWVAAQQHDLTAAREAIARIA